MILVLKLQYFKKHCEVKFDYRQNADKNLNKAEDKNGTGSFKLNNSIYSEKKFWCFTIREIKNYSSTN